MARPRGAPKPQARNRRPRRPENREHLASLTSEVLRLHLQALNLSITRSKAQLVKRLQNATQPAQRPLAEGRKPAGHSQKGKGKGKTRLARPAVAQPDPVAEVTYDSSSASSEDDSEIPLDVDPFEQSVILDGPARDLEQRQIPFTPGPRPYTIKALRPFPTLPSLFIPFRPPHLAHNSEDLAQPRHLASKGLLVLKNPGCPVISFPRLNTPTLSLQTLLRRSILGG